MKRIFLSLIWILIYCSSAVYAQDVAVKSNIIYWGTTTPNAGFELALDRKVTLDISAAYNPWTFKDDKKMRLWLVQPEVKYWFCEKYEGHFVGIHLHGAQYFGGFKKKRLNPKFRCIC